MNATRARVEAGRSAVVPEVPKTLYNLCGSASGNIDVDQIIVEVLCPSCGLGGKTIVSNLDGSDPNPCLPHRLGNEDPEH